MLAPAKWFVQLIALLPVALRPGVFLAVILAILWFVLVRRGLPALWRRAWRGVAVCLDLIVGVSLFPEYVLTSARRSRGQPPGQAARATAPIADRALDAAAALYEANVPKKPATDQPSKKKFPWLWCALIVAVCAGAYIAMEQTSRADEARHTLAEVFDYWRDVEDWGEVDPSRRAATGDPAQPSLTSVSYHRRVVHVALRCVDSNPCVGTVDIRTRAGTTVSRQSIEVPAASSRVATLKLPHRPAASLRHLHVDVRP
jgi:hypothetical protein